MLDDNSLIQCPDSDLDKAIDKSLLSLPLDDAQKAITEKIIEADSEQELEKNLNLFNITQRKKNAIRAIKLNSLLDRVEDQAIERFQRRPDEISNKELLDYMSVVSAQIERSQKSAIDITENAKPIIQINKNKQDVNINVGPELSRDSKEKVIDAIKNLIGQINESSEKQSTNIPLKKELVDSDIHEDVIVINASSEDDSELKSDNR